MRFVIQTLGCKMNQYESQAMRESLGDAGFIETDDIAAADTLIINSCSVTGRAGASCRNLVRKALRANPHLRLVVTGCAVDAGESWPRELGSAITIPNAKKHAVADYLLRDSANMRQAQETPDDCFGLAISRFRNHTRAFIKIQDGCDNYCSYCIVPLARGKPQSRPPAAILREAAALAANGHPEIALTGINIGAYDYDGLTLAGLALRLAATPGLERLRLSSLEPQFVDAELLSVMADNPAICPHLHLPLQSGDQTILSLMRRRYTPGQYLAIVDKIRDKLDHPAIGADVIVGFPGEQEEEFGHTYELCRRIGFARIHVFLFSPRPGTPAAAMRQSASDRDIETRKNRLLALAEQDAQRFAASCVGRRERAIVEANGALTDRYLRARIAGRNLRQGQTVPIRIVGVSGVELATELDL